MHRIISWVTLKLSFEVYFIFYLLRIQTCQHLHNRMLWPRIIHKFLVRTFPFFHLLFLFYLLLFLHPSSVLLVALIHLSFLSRIRTFIQGEPFQLQDQLFRHVLLIQGGPEWKEEYLSMGEGGGEEGLQSFLICICLIYRNLDKYWQVKKSGKVESEKIRRRGGVILPNRGGYRKEIVGEVGGISALKNKGLPFGGSQFGVANFNYFYIRITISPFICLLFKSNFIEIFMTSISWNDIEGDDSSISDLSSEGQIHPHPSQFSSLKKVFSTPPSKLTENDPVTEENLLKLSEHKGEKAWLYSPSFYKNREQEVNNLINKMQCQEEVHRGQQGWNILVKTEIAKQLIQSGYFSNGMKLKFFYSKNNDRHKPTYEPKNNKNKFKGNRANGGFASPKNKFDKPTNVRNIKSKQKPIYKEKNSEEQIKEKKKVKYVAKIQKVEEKLPQTPIQQPNSSEKTAKQEEKEVVPQKNDRPVQIKEEKKKEQNVENEYKLANGNVDKEDKKESVHKKAEEKKQKQKKADEQKEERDSEQSTEERKKKVSKHQKNKQAQKHVEQVKQNKEERQKEDRDSEESLEQMRKKVSKYQKKNQKKKQKKKAIDDNNPFSYFDQ